MPILVIINPGNGPGLSPDRMYLLSADQLRSAGVKVIGYVFTGYSKRAGIELHREIDLYKNWYGVDGIFFDEVANSGESKSYYMSLATYTRSVGLGVTVGNPGIRISRTFSNLEEAFDILNIYENSGLPPAAMLEGKGKRGVEYSIISYGVDQFDRSDLLSLEDFVSYVYLTDSLMPNPYERLPTYFGSLIEALDALP